MKVGILGAGNIAVQMAKTLNLMTETEAYAVASRDPAKAQAFARANHVAKAYGSYEAMLEDAEVGLIYVATPHSHHYEHIKLCLDYGKPVLCEKAFTANADQAREVLALGKEKGLLVAEAIWTRYMPMRWKIKEIMDSGVIGQPACLSASLGYYIEKVPRISDPALAGGALLDVGVYTLNFASMFFGNSIAGMVSNCVKTDTGVDASSGVVIAYKDGKMATLYSTTRAVSERRGIICGPKGQIEVANINNFEKITVYGADYQPIAVYDRPEQYTGYEYEVQAAINAIREGKTECEDMPHSEIIEIMEQMDALRAQMSIKYPFE
ncbi:MAG: Gfo/Idh/MocA family oxidoreductase [Oscillospiraceae bacterium]|jgi:predicted dehydrogenase|nr:Gfo/Idh/MocA family oxidoreductase [Oscillospiraceae bacterium]